MWCIAPSSKIKLFGTKLTKVTWQYFSKYESTFTLVRSDEIDKNMKNIYNINQRHACIGDAKFDILGCSTAVMSHINCQTRSGNPWRKTLISGFQRFLGGFIKFQHYGLICKLKITKQ